MTDQEYQNGGLGLQRKEENIVTLALLLWNLLNAQWLSVVLRTGSVDLGGPGLVEKPRSRRAGRRSRSSLSKTR